MKASWRSSLRLFHQFIHSHQFIQLNFVTLSVQLVIAFWSLLGMFRLILCESIKPYSILPLHYVLTVPLCTAMKIPGGHGVGFLQPS
jgi:hypothetical protein